MIEFKADLHCHSHFSDGTLSPQELIELAHEKRLGALSITDHDTLEAYAMAKPHADRLGLQLLPGIELSAVYQNESIHVLGYGYRPDSPALIEFCQHQKQRRQHRNLAILEKFKALGICIEEHELLAKCGSQASTIGRPHIAQCLIEKGVVKNFKQAFKKYLGNTGRCYVVGPTISVEECVEIIHQSHGKAVLAHPHRIKKKSTLKAMLEMPFDGLEVHYANLPLKQELPFFWLAKDKGWLMTGGSDYHGHTHPFLHLGQSWCPQDSFDRLWAHYTGTEN